MKSAGSVGTFYLHHLLPPEITRGGSVCIRQSLWAIRPRPSHHHRADRPLYRTSISFASKSLMNEYTFAYANTYARTHKYTGARTNKHARRYTHAHTYANHQHTRTSSQTHAHIPTISTHAQTHVRTRTSLHA